MSAHMNYSVREFRHIANRFLHARGALRHMVNPVRDVLTFAQARGFDALTELERTQDAIASFDGRVHTDSIWSASGQSGYYVAPTIIDLLVLQSGPQESVVQVHDLRGGEVFHALDDYAAVRGLHLGVVALNQASVTLAYRTDPWAPTGTPLDAEGPAVREALSSGFDADTDQFWRMFRASDQALTPDSEMSRNHAGSQIYDEHGNVIGESDEEDYGYIRTYATEGAQ